MVRSRNKRVDQTRVELGDLAKWKSGSSEEIQMQMIIGSSFMIIDYVRSDSSRNNRVGKTKEGSVSGKERFHKE